MKTSIKKGLSLLLACVLCLSMLTVAPFAFGDDLVAINSANFTDATFRQVISDYFDDNSDGYLSADERSNSFISISGYIDVETESISDLKGIEYFTNLSVLRCGGIGLESLDVSALTGLTALSCQGNALTSLDLAANTSLQTVNCSDNALTSLTLPSTNTLTTVHCYANQLESLDISVVPQMRELRCDQNKLTSLDLTNSSNLSLLYCSQNSISAIDLSTTAITGATNSEIGNQIIDVVAELEYGVAIVPFANRGLTADNYRGCSLEAYGDGSSYEGDRFSVYNLDDVTDGFTYECYPYEENSENITVKINVIRDFYQVSFYTDESLSESLGVSIISSGADAYAPKVTDIPQCKSFAGWSDDITNVTEDKRVYVVWGDGHSYSPTAMADDKDTITVTCENCGSSYQVSFISVVNTKTGDEKFDENLDVVKDGYINAKDYDVLYKTLG